MEPRFWHGAYGASIGSTLFYYVTYVLRLGGWERMQVPSPHNFVCKRISHTLLCHET